MFVRIFATVLLPLTLIALAAYLLGRYRRVDPRPVASVTFYLFNPCLAFTALAHTAVAPDLLGRMALLKVLGYAAMIPLAAWIARRLKLPGPAVSAFVMAAIFANSGNYGLSVNEWAFGQAGLALAVIGYVVDNLAMNSLGVYIAARGRATARRSFLQVFLNPAIYALALGMLVHEFGWQVPLPLERTTEMLGRAAVPTMLAVLGMQLAALPLKIQHLRPISVVVSLRLVVAPLIAAALTVPLGLTDLARQVGIAQAAPPTAVTASILASQFDVEPGVVSGAVLISSVASLITMTVLLTWLSR